MYHMKNKSKVKKAILLSGLVTVMLCSCINEDTDSCSAMRNLKFSHYCAYDPDESFDNVIANDVFLCIYHDNKLKYMEQVPYKKIQGGKAYSYRKRYGGNVHIAAWAVPEGSSTQLPQWDYDEDFYGQFLEEQTRTRITRFEPFYDDLYLGTVLLTDDDIAVETTHHIKMIDVACQIWITVNDPANLFNDPAKELYVILDGAMSGVDLLYRGIREEAEIYAGFTKEDTGLYTRRFSALPSAEKQSVGISLYYGDDRVVTVQTGEKAISGGRIIINLTLGTNVYVNVNGFEVIPSEVKWM